MANKLNWSEGLKKTLAGRGISFETIILNESQDTNIFEIVNVIQTVVKEIKEPIIWNGGGGQKIQFAALWECFKARGGKDKLCYTNQNSKDLEFWRFENNESKTYLEEIDVDLEAHEILNTFGFEVKSKNLIFAKGVDLMTNKTLDLMRFAEFREYFYNSPLKTDLDSSNTYENFIQKIKNSKKELEYKVKNELLKPEFVKNYIAYASKFANDQASEKEVEAFNKLVAEIYNLYFGKNGDVFNLLKGEFIKEPIIIKEKELENALSEIGYEESGQIKYESPLLSKLFPFKNMTSKYFEILLAQNFVEMVLNNTCSVKYIYMNLETSKNGIITAEYDLLCVTKQGTLIAIDAKTFSFKRKDSDARLQNLIRGGGRFVKFITVLPYNIEDLDIMSEELKRLPFTLEKNRIPFYVYGQEKETFYVKNFENNSYLKTDKNEIDSVEFKPFNNIISMFQ